MRECLLGATRYDEFKARLPIADNVLSRRLATMVEQGLLVKAPYIGTQRTHDGYHLTERGADLLPVLNTLALWGNKHTDTPEGGGLMRLVHSTCGAETTSGDTCTGCGDTLTAATTGWLRTWRGDAVKELTVPSA